MSLRILILLFIALPFVIYGKKTPKIFVKEVAVLDEYAANGTMIANDALILIENGFLGEGTAGFVYAGQLAVDNHQVAIKFIPTSNSDAAQNEYKILKRMEADTNPEIEDLGIPALYYYGEWNHFILIAITQLDESLDEISETRTISPLEIMHLFKSFVIKFRYMHIHGVRHGDIHLNNIMFRSNQSFIIDFDRAQIMEEECAYLWTHADLKAFISAILKLHINIGITGSWDSFKRRLSNRNLDEGLLSVIKKFGDEAFATKRSDQFPNYDGLEKLIKKKIENPGGGSGSRLNCLCL